MQEPTEAAEVKIRELSKFKAKRRSDPELLAPAKGETYRLISPKLLF